jgi:hypothetical protein
MNSGSVICHIGKQIFFVHTEDVEEINKIREFCESICLEKISQYLEAKYPNSLEKVMDWD